MKNKLDDNFLLNPSEKDKTLKQVKQGYVEEYKQKLQEKKALKKKSEDLKPAITAKKEKKESSKFDYSKLFEYQEHKWTFGPLSWDKKEKIKQKIKEIESKMKKLGDVKRALSIDMTLFRNDLIYLIKQIFPKHLLIIPKKDVDDMYYDKKTLAAQKTHQDNAYEFFLEKFVQQFYNYSIGNFEGYTGWGSSSKNNLIVRTLKMIEQLQWRL